MQEFRRLPLDPRHRADDFLDLRQIPSFAKLRAKIRQLRPGVRIEQLRAHAADDDVRLRQLARRDQRAHIAHRTARVVNQQRSRVRFQRLPSLLESLL